MSRFLLVSGPRRSSKTVGILHKMMLHAWRTPRAKICMVSVSQTTSTDGGAWDMLADEIAQQWIDGGFGMRWVKKPYVDGTTKKLKFSVLNCEGGTSTFQLDSLKYEYEAERRFKGKGFTFIYVSELSNFTTSTIFYTLIECLRQSPLVKKVLDLQIVADTNPAPEGEDSWIYNLWWQLRASDEVPEEQKQLQRDLGLMEFTVDDNIFLTPLEKERLRAQWMSDPDLFNRYWLGKWNRAIGDGIFSDVFKPAIHLMGQIAATKGGAPEIMFPEDNCFELKSGWDLGDKNPACVLGETFRMLNDRHEEVSGFKVLDEIIYLGQYVATTDFANEVMSKMEWWETQADRKIKWFFWSDKDRFSANTDNSEHKLIYAVSGKKIQLRAVERYAGSVASRVKILRKLLFEERIFINRARCPRIVEMLQSLRKPKVQDRPEDRALRVSAVDRKSLHKHAFDALTYWLAEECANELDLAIYTPRTAAATKPVMVEL